MMKNRIFKSLLAMACLLGSTGVSAYDFEVDGIYYDVVSLTEFTCEVAKNSYSGDIVIPATVDYANKTLTVVGITDEAFKSCSNLTGITIPNTISSIGNYAFNSCTKLERVTIEDGETVLALGYNTYSYSSIGKGLFYDCPITTLYIGRNLSYNTNSYYGYSPFCLKSSSSIKELTIGNSVTSIGSYAFYNCSGLTSVEIPNSVTSIGSSAFSYCGLTSVEIPNSVTSIGSSAFESCYRLTSVEIPNSVTSIGDYAFYGCSGLTSVTIGNSVTKIGSSAFRNCISLKKVIVKDLAAWCGINFSDDSSNPLCCASHLYSDEETEITALIIPDGVKSINYCAFYSCSGLTSVEIPNSVTSIGSSAFSYCGLTSVTIGNSVTSIGSLAFYSCYRLTSVEIPNSVTSIGERAFWYCRSLTSVTIGNSVTKIESYAFVDCSSLATLYSLNTIPPSVGIGNFTNNHYMTLNVYVPQEALVAYQSADTWKDFWNLQGFDAAGMESVKSDSGNAGNVYYDLRGNRLDAPKRGLNIINHRKVVMKQ